ncbi:hypothetical protein ACR8AL_07790 [Clavibacter sepedonicus]|uniref:Uncharacterized protein n=1 Tax=Clavibacter sepedonicus TaxID=31964 RepID=B0RCQ2_CLASE|nr:MULTISPECIES: hypothetical protein [Clavibacter]MBD5381771.1 hypothetical protein [Clavibacter sp.]OQJ47485.1 hypothetical protein B5P19_03745 [Clavibacter sepedonicus]OQJ53040.1 hypothetical protein B5P20_02005 [Clavibacter sepedonicus]UUK67063.1 hypothetical protein LRE50_07660 [Clavibacter sepedonicus]CAQ01823.1 hypothetical protein CMS1721 [Clavibacter sepedonicus]
MADTLDDLLSADPHRIWQASREIIGTRDTALLDALRTALPAILRATAGVELGGMMRPDRDALDHALRKVRDHRSWWCWCDDHPRLPSFDPTREEERGHARVLRRDRAAWPVTYECGCVVCGRRFDVEEGEHHALWWRWTARRR